MLGSRLRVRQYPNRRNRAIHLIAEDMLGTSISSNLAARRLERGAVSTQSSTGGKGITTAVSILVALLATAARILIPLLPRKDLQGLAESSQPSITNLPAPIYFVPLLVLTVLLFLVLIRLRLRYKGWSINWNRATFLTYVLAGLVGGCILIVGLDSERSIALVVWLGYLLLLVAVSALFYILLRVFSPLGGQRYAFGKREFAVLFISTAISTNVVLCGVVGVMALPDGWMDQTSARTAEEVAAYAFPFVTLLLVFLTVVTFPSWLDFRHTVRVHREAMERSASRALTRWIQSHAGPVNQVGISQMAHELGWRLGPALFKTNIIGCIMFLFLKAAAAAGRKTTKWTDVSQFQTDVFEEAILSTCLASCDVSATQHATGVEQRIMAERSELVKERIRRAVALRCARLIYGTHRTRRVGGVISVGEDTLTYAAGIANMVADYSCSLHTSRLIQHHLRGHTSAEKVYSFLKRVWRLM